jgi:CopG family nickel-responsive transcriptional regulator
MAQLSRIGVAIDSDLLEKFDSLISTRGYTNRSEAFRDLIRDELVEKAWEKPDSLVVGTVTLVYDHHVRMLSDKLTDLQHDHFHHVLSTLHVHLDHDNCLEVLVLKGKASAVRKLADALISTKGVKHGRLTITTSGSNLDRRQGIDLAEVPRSAPLSRVPTVIALCNGSTPSEMPMSSARQILNATLRSRWGGDEGNWHRMARRNCGQI